jgi:hypothetical protein
VSRASAAGVTWTSRTLNAEWAARGYHTSVVDAAGAIYVIGGNSYHIGDRSFTVYPDVWVSTDGGARPDSVGDGQRGTRWILRGVLGVQNVWNNNVWNNKGLPRRLCGRCGGTAGTGGINSSAGDRRRPRVRGCGLVRSALGVARVCRRCHVDEPHTHGAMGWPIWAHVRDRRRRRDLRHQRHRRHLLPGRVGERRRRCAGRTASWGMVGG